ncbi:MAG: HesA/MoeB/ThiF family protein [Chloroflexota bacterium]
MHNLLASRIKSLAVTSGELRLLSLEHERVLADEWGVSPREVQLAALAAHVLPARYQRSLGTVGWEGQARLLRASVGVVGAGGLGGYIVEALARMGVGRLLVIDCDVFEEHNLNRQLLCTEENLGASKAVAAVERAARLNGAVEVEAKHERMTDDNALDLLAGVELVVDALDSLPARFTVERATKALGVPLVHGAIAGYIAQVMTIFPED